MRHGLETALVWGWCLAATAAGANLAPTGPRVPGFERFYAAADADRAAAGRLLLTELNCLSCHAADSPATGAVAPKKAPVLDEVGGRVRPEWIADFLANPHAVKPGTTMPDVLTQLPADERAAAVQALTHFLASTGSVSDTHPDPTAAKRGKALFQRVGCAACHNPLSNEAVDLPTSVALPDVAKKYTATSLAAFLKDPLKSRPSGRMPAFNLKDEEYRDLSQHFLRGVRAAPNVKFAVYHGHWDKLPNLDELKPVETGECSGFDVSVAGRDNDFAIRFTTYWHVRAPAQHQFYLGSDDGSRLIIDGQKIVDNDGIHPHQEVKGRHSFEVGWRTVVVDFMQGGGEQSLTVDIDGNGLKRQPLAGLVSLTKESPAAAEPPQFVVNGGLAERGRMLFSSLGCAACHQFTADGQALKSTRAAKPLAQLRMAAGCLAEQPPPAAATYRLSGAQRQALAAALSGDAPAETPADSLHRALLTFNCYACHKRGEIGGVEEARDAYFESSQKEMGDEGRLPPPLTGVGDKLQDDWLKHVLAQGASDRQLYMRAKMPKFGGGNVGQLAAAFIALDRQPDAAPRVDFHEPEYRIKAAGRQLVGATALSCIKCHDFGPHPSQGVRAINLTTMTRRLREDWFHRYLLNPQDYRPGTRMPAPWPFGQTTIRDVLNAEVNPQVRAVWKYLADGDKAPVPVGLVREPIELKPGETPVLYRNFIEGAGARAIGVGYPERANLAWDANDMRLALIWHGAFIDASRHWNGRGQGFEPPLGDDVLSLPVGLPLASLTSLNDSWPDKPAREAGFHFRGYRLGAGQRPEFQYAVGGLAVVDAPAPVLAEGAKFPHLRRVLTISGDAGAAPWHFRAAVAGQIEPVGEDAYRVDGVWTLKVVAADKPLVRTSGGKQELLVPLRPGAQPQTIQLEYVW